MGGGPTQIKGHTQILNSMICLPPITTEEVAHPPHPVPRIKSLALTCRAERLSAKPHPLDQASLHDLGPHSRASGLARWGERWNLPSLVQSRSIYLGPIIAWHGDP